MGKAVRIAKGDRLTKVLAEGTECLNVGRRRFRPVEVKADDNAEPAFYEPKDPEEIRVLEEALNDDSELLGVEEGRSFLRERLRQHGIG